MPSYTVEVPDERERERGIRIECDEHGDAREFHPAERSVAFHCEGCGYEVELRLHDLLDWRDWGERC